MHTANQQRLQKRTNPGTTAARWMIGGLLSVAVAWPFLPVLVFLVPFALLLAPVFVLFRAEHAA